MAKKTKNNPDPAVVSARAEARSRARQKAAASERPVKLTTPVR